MCVFNAGQTSSGGSVSFFCDLYCVSVFEVGEVSVPSQSNYIHIKDTKLGWQEVEIYHLSCWPNTPIGLVKLPKFVSKFLLRLNESVTLHHSHTQKVPGPQRWRRNQLINEHFLADIIYAIANEVFVEPLVPIVHEGAHRASHSKHTTCPRPVTCSAGCPPDLSGLLDEVSRRQHSPAAYRIGDDQKSASEKRLPVTGDPDQKLLTLTRYHVDDDFTQNPLSCLLEQRLCSSFATSVPLTYSGVNLITYANKMSKY